MTQTEFAAHRGVGKSAVSNWKARGLLAFAPADPGRPHGRQLVDVQRSDAAVNAAVDPTLGRPPTAIASSPAAPALSENPAGASDGLANVRNELIRAQTVRARLQNEKLAGELVALVEFERRAGDAGRLARERMHGVARQLAERLAAETDPRSVLAVLAEAIDQAFADLADRLEAEALAELEVDAELEAEELELEVDE